MTGYLLELVWTVIVQYTQDILYLRLQIGFCYEIEIGDRRYHKSVGDR